MSKLIVISMLFIPVIGYSQVTYFNNRYEFTGYWDGATSVLETDSGYIMSGETGAGGFDGSIALLFIDKQGNILAKKSYGAFGLDFYGGISGSLTKIFNGGYALGGSVSISSGISMGILWKFYSTGDTAWTKYFGDSTQYFEAFYQCKQTPDSGFILIGATDKPDSGGNTDIWLVKTDKNGNFEWDTTYGGAGVEYGFSVDVCFDGGFILGGYTNSFGNGGYDTYIVKTDSAGNKLWDKTYGGIYDDNGAYVIQTFDSGFFICTALEKFQLGPNAYKQTYLIKTDGAGTIEWDTTYGPTRYGTGPGVCSQLGDGSFVITGQQLNKDSIALSGNIQGFILKVSSQGDILWYRVHEYDTCEKNDDYFRDMKPTSDGGFIVAGFFVPNTSFQCNDTGTQDMWVAKMDSCGCLYAGCDSACQGLVGVNEFRVSDFGFQVFPNPTVGRFTVEIHNKIAEQPYQINIYDILGRNISHIKTEAKQLEVDISKHQAGVYLIQVWNENNYYSARVVKY